MGNNVPTEDTGSTSSGDFLSDMASKFANNPDAMKSINGAMNTVGGYSDGKLTGDNTGSSQTPPDPRRAVSAAVFDMGPVINKLLVPHAGEYYQGPTGWGNAVIGHDNSGYMYNRNQPWQGLTGDQFSGIYNLARGGKGNFVDPSQNNSGNGNFLQMLAKLFQNQGGGQ